MKRVLSHVAASAAMLSLLAPLSALNAAGFAVVKNANDAGPGSLRHALEEQQADLVFVPGRIGDISIESTLEYSATKPVTIIGKGQTIRISVNETVLAITQGANLTVTNLDFEGPGGFSILNRGDLDGPAGKGIFVDVRDDQTGMVRVNLKNVTVSGVANHGIHISDCSLSDDCGGGSGGAGDGSAASISLICDGCRVEDAGNGKFDADGIRIDDRGDGSIFFGARNSVFTGVGADGVELDEGDDGSVWVNAVRTEFTNNGGYCDPVILSPFVPVPDEAEFDEADAVTEEEIPGPVTGSPDDSCIERGVDLYDSGFVEAYEFGLDLDDGIDLDEAGAGSIYSWLRNSVVNDNLDEGVDLDEAGDGDMIFGISRTEATGNTDDGIKLSEEDAGGVFGELRRVTAANNGGKGAVFEEEADGDVVLNVVRTNTFNNDDSDNTGIEAVQEDAGEGSLFLKNSDIADGLDLDGVELL